MLSRLPSSPPPAQTPTPPEIVYLLEVMDASPITSAHVKQWTAKDRTLTKLQEALVTGNQKEEQTLKP